MYVDYENEILVLGAIRLAERIINALDDRRIDEIDIDKEIARLKELAALGMEIANPSQKRSEAPSASNLSPTPTTANL